MIDFSKIQIDGTQSAKSFFQGFGCSHFHMSREYPDRYSEYEALNIAKDKERQWIYEIMNLRFELLSRTDTEPEVLWSLHSYMADLAQKLETEEALELVYQATVSIAERLTKRDKLITAETINGRGLIQNRTGLIFLAQDLNQTGKAKYFSEVALIFLQEAKKARIERKRCNRALSTCKEIRTILGFDS